VNKTIVLIVLLVALISSGALEASPTCEPSRHYRVNGTEYLNVRDGASAGHEIIGALPPNARDVVIDGCDGQWCHVSWRALTGWVNARFLKRQEDGNVPLWLLQDTTSSEHLRRRQ
jgi:uncharacterized protein YraI